MPDSLQRMKVRERGGEGEKKRGVQDGVGKDGVVSSSAGDKRQTGEERSDVISARCKDGQQRNISRACSASQCAHTPSYATTWRNTHTHQQTLG